MILFNQAGPFADVQQNIVGPSGLRNAFWNKESTSFFAKKEAKKLLFAAGFDTGRANARIEQKFFASFFQKRSAFNAPA
jgi:hypothetical protein